MSPKLRSFFKKVTTGILEGKAGQKAKEVSKITNKNIAELDMKMTEDALKDMSRLSKSKKPFFMSINLLKTTNLTFHLKSLLVLLPEIEICRCRNGARLQCRTST